MSILTSIDPTKVRGTGSNLYAIIKVDQDDAEDSTLDQVLEDFTGDDEFFGDQLLHEFENEIWGFLWLPRFIGPTL